jgi:DNA-binding beta-propeller fold protein YncE
MRGSLAILAVALAGAAGVSRPEAPVASPYLSPAALAVEGDTVFIAHATGRKLEAYDLARRRSLWSAALDEEPTGVAAAGSLVYATAGHARGTVYAVDGRTGKVAGRFAAGHSPVAPVVSADGRTLWVSNRYEHTVRAIDLGTRRARYVTPVEREPSAAAFSHDGARLFVANMLPAAAATEAHVAAPVSVIDVASGRVLRTVRLPDGSTTLRGIAVSPDGAHVYVTHDLGRHRIATTQSDRGWIWTAALSILDGLTGELRHTILLDDVDRGAASPWGVACSSDGFHLFVAHAGTHELSVIDRGELHRRLAAPRKNDLTGVLSFLDGARERIALPGRGPHAIVVKGNSVLAAEYYSDSLAIVDPAGRRAASVRLGPVRPIDTVRRGEMLFHDATVAFQQWFSCSNCHPGGGRADGLNWDLMNDGFGNPKNTRSLLLAAQTPPSMSLGVRKDYFEAVRAGVNLIEFTELPESDLQALAAYIASLAPLPSPALRGGKLSEAAQRGAKFYEQAECGKCHPGPRYTDLKRYDVGTGRGHERNAEFDTPTLVEVWRTAPYLHDGSAATIEDVLTQANRGDQHGKTSKLTPAQIADLAEYVRSL